MFGPMFDWILAAILGVLSIVLLAGKGDAVLKKINGNRRVANRKMSEKDKIKYSRAMGVFTGVLALDEVFVALFPNNRMVLTVNIIVAVIALIAIGNYGKKYR
ncbi:MAG: DUF3784 domain-containing protein [Clostridiales bacterium]|nr:DUF3784 domain-containing protein [Clostridiales bacterium]